VPCPGGNGDFAGGCHAGVLELAAICGAADLVSAVDEGAAGGGEGLTLEIVIEMVLCEMSVHSDRDSANDS
jgi:hypothetical protein